MDYLMSGRRGRNYTELFDQAMADGPFTDLRVAVAYATIGGVKLLEQTLMEGFGEGRHKKSPRPSTGILNTLHPRHHLSA
jgi:hypothetical protein